MKPLSTFEKWYGRNEPPPLVSHLKAGRFDLEFENGDLRYIRFGNQELIRRIYVAIRDVNWNTIPARLTQPDIQIAEEHFRIRFGASHQDGSLKFSWQALIEGNPDGGISYSMDGVAGSDFRYCRIGFCVLHPVEGIAGSPYTALTPEGELSGVLPRLIEPQWIVDGFETAIYPACNRLTIQTPTGIAVTTAFEGDLFETEDQRNWSDGSFKTYCTPIALGYPHNAVQGLEFYQKVIVKIDIPDHFEEPQPVISGKPILLELGQAGNQSIPEIGFGIQDQPAKLENREMELLSNIKPDFLKAEIHFREANWQDDLDRAMSTAEQLGSPLELALFLSDQPLEALNLLKSKLKYVPLARLIVFHEDEAPNGTTSANWMQLARQHLADALPGVKFYGGTNGNFAELNRQRPDSSVMDGVAYTLNPQVHAFDERSLVENIEGQRDTVITARSFSASLPIAISSVTLKPPFNQASTEEEAPPDPNELPPFVDQRQMSLFGAAWTTGSLRALTAGGADSITYYQSTGWLGLSETSQGNPLPDKFRSFPAMVYPLYYIFEFIAGVSQANFVNINIQKPLLLQAFAFKTADRIGLITSNLQPVDSHVQLHSLPEGIAQLRRLNEDTFDLAVSDPAAFLKSSQPETVHAGKIELMLKPYETVFLEFQIDQR